MFHNSQFVAFLIIQGVFLLFYYYSNQESINSDEDQVIQLFLEQQNVHQVVESINERLEEKIQWNDEHFNELFKNLDKNKENYDELVELFNKILDKDILNKQALDLIKEQLTKLQIFNNEGDKVREKRYWDGGELPQELIQFTNEIQEKMHKLQFESDCDRILLITWDAYYGLMSTFTAILYGFYQGYLSNRTVVIHDFGMIYSNPTICGDERRGVKCWFEPITNCELSSEYESWEAFKALPAYNDNNREATDTVVRFSTSVKKTNNQLGSHFFKVSFQPILFFWKPSEKTQAKVVELKDSLKTDFDFSLGQRFITVHIRGGVYAKAEGHELKPPHYFFFEPIRRICEDYGIKHVFIMAEDAEMITELRSVFPQFIFFQINPNTFPSNRMTPGRPIKNWLRQDYPLVYNETDDEGLVFIANMLIAAEADFIIGDIASNVDRFLISLAAQRQGFPPRYMDIRNDYLFVGGQNSNSHINCAKYRWQNVPDYLLDYLTVEETFNIKKKLGLEEEEDQL